MRPRIWCLALLLASCGPDRFLSVSAPTQANLRGIHAVTADDFWLVGDAGTALRWDGAAFTDTSSDADPGPRVPGFHAVGSLREQVVIAGDQGIVLGRQGLELPSEPTGTDARLLTVFRAGPDTLYAAGDSGIVLRRGRDEDRWSRVRVGAGNTRITGGWAISEASVVFSTDQGAIIEQVAGEWSTQTVVTETSTVPLPLFDVWSSTAGADLVAVGLGGSVYRRPAGEVAWTQEATPVQQDLYALFGTAADDLYAVGARGTVLHYDGLTWRGVPSSTAEDLFAIDGTVDRSLVVAVGTRGAMVVLRRE